MSLRRIAAAPAALIAALALLPGCAQVLSLRGERQRKEVTVQVSGRVEATGGGTGGHLAIALSNQLPDAMGVDVDKIELRDGAGGHHPALGALQRFRGRASSAGGEMRRVPHGAMDVPPGETRTIELEFAELPARERVYNLVVPSLFRLGIEGQEPLTAVRVPLQTEVGATAPAAVDGGFYDPFVE